MNLQKHGFSIIPTALPGETLAALSNTVFQEESAGERCLLDHAVVRDTAIALKRELSVIGHIRSDAIANHGEITCLAKMGDVLLMRPLALHASSQATEPKNRRVLHFVYYSSSTIPETWHRSI